MQKVTGRCETLVEQASVDINQSVRALYERRIHAGSPAWRSQNTAKDLRSQHAHPHRQGDVAGLAARSRCPLRRRGRRRFVVPCGRDRRAANAVLGRQRGAEQRVRCRAPAAETLLPRRDLPLPLARCCGGLAAGALWPGSDVSFKGNWIAENMALVQST